MCILSVRFVLSWRPQCGQMYCVCLWMSSCVRKRAIFLNFFWQYWQWNGYSSLCVIWCSFNAPFATKLLPHSSHMKGLGTKKDKKIKFNQLSIIKDEQWIKNSCDYCYRSPVCIARMWACTFTSLLNRLSQNWHGWINFSSSGKCTISWRCSFVSDGNRFGHFVQANGLSDLGWFSRMCASNCRLFSKSMLQSGQLENQKTIY